LQQGRDKQQGNSQSVLHLSDLVVGGVPCIPSCSASGGVVRDGGGGGARAQIHLLQNSEVRCFSRNSEDTTGKFPDIRVLFPDVLPFDDPFDRASPRAPSSPICAYLYISLPIAYQSRPPLARLRPA